jgi:5-methylthioadenosine/S-adenosylhomocysteine deaminase
MITEKTGSELIWGASLLTGDVANPELLGGGCIVEDGSIVAVGEAGELRQQHSPARERGGEDRVIMPGLVNSHIHAFGTPALQLGLADAPLNEWMGGLMGLSGADRELDLAFLTGAFLSAGVTTAIVSHYPEGGNPAEEVKPIVAGFEEAGMRLGCAVGFMNRNVLTWNDAELLDSLPDGLKEFASMLVLDGTASPDDYIAATRGIEAGDRLSVLFGPVGPRQLTPAAMEAIVAAANADGRPLHMHLLDALAERVNLEAELGQPLVAWLDRIGALNERTSVAHAIHTTPEERRLFAERGVTVICNTSGNLRLGEGITPVGDFHDAGAAVGIGSDDMTLSSDSDHLAEMRLGVALARLEDSWMSPAEAIAATTSVGARAAGLGELVGTISPGKRADLLLLDLERISAPGFAADVTPLDLVAAKATARDVRAVLVDGEVLVEDGEHRRRDFGQIVAEMRGQIKANCADPEAVATLATAKRLGVAIREFDGSDG